LTTFCQERKWTHEGAHEDPHLINALASAAFLGWFVFQPLLRHGFGLPADAEQQLAQLLALVDAWVSGAAAPPARERR
jgi:hypothetical protein